MTKAAIVHPITGELLDGDNLAALEKAQADIDEHFAIIRRDNGPVYQARDLIRARAAELRGIGHVTSVPARWRSDAQQRVFRCPHCNKTVETAA